MKLLTKTLLINALFTASIVQAASETIKAEAIELSTIQHEAQVYVADHITKVKVSDLFISKDMMVAYVKDKPLKANQALIVNNPVIAE